MSSRLYIVTGAPGAGKSTTLNALLQLHTPYIAFDIDWLTLPASQLANKDVIMEPSTGPAYRALWFAILGMLANNHHHPIFFTALTPHHIRCEPLPQWWTHLYWLRLDCADAVRHRRLQDRPAWTAGMIAEAMDEAVALRSMVSTAIRTDVHTPTEVARMLVEWIETTMPPKAHPRP